MEYHAIFHSFFCGNYLFVANVIKCSYIYTVCKNMNVGEDAMEKKTEREIREIMQKQKVIYPQNYDEFISEVLERLTEKEQKNETD